MNTSVGWAMISSGLLGLSIVSIGYPVLVRILAAFVADRRDSAGDGDAAPSSPNPGAGPAESTAGGPAIPSVTVIVAMRNAEALLPAKVDSIAALEDPGAGIAVLLSSDGSTDSTVKIAKAACESRSGWHVLEEPEHLGKHCALNAAASHAAGEILVFTDVDAVLEPGAVGHLVRAFTSPKIGGVCGQRMIGEASTFATSSQARYVELDSGLKGMESRIGSITSNDGKLYAIRAGLFEDIPGGVTDDLFANMSVVRQGFRFVFEGRARAWIKTPSRNKTHELSRRRRIVCRSFRGMWLQRSVLNPFRTGLYGIGLLINKVGRRLLPFFLLSVYVGTILLAGSSRIALAAALVQTLGLIAAWIGPRIFAQGGEAKKPSLPAKMLSLAHYALVGFVGTFFGVVDFAMARKVVRWNPVKSD